MNGGVVMHAIVQGLHDVFAAMWAGGLLTMAVVVVQSMKAARGLQERTKSEGHTGVAGPERFMVLLQKRLRKVVTVAIVGVFVTGILLLRLSLQSSGGVFESSLYSTLIIVKVVLSVIMVLVAIMRSAKLRRFNEGSSDPRESGLPLLFTNAAIAVVVLMLSGVASVVH
jgi:uncharacterized membrane protein